MENGNRDVTPYRREIDLGIPGVSAFVVIDSFLGGGGTGGIRMGEGVTQQEVADLAHEMSLKFAWLNIPRGGAKAGICYDTEPGNEEKARVCTRFGEAISDLLGSGKYVAGMDLGVGREELNRIMAGAGMRQDESAGNRTINSNFFTALTVFSALDALLDEKDLEVGDSSFLIEGAGKVGSYLMQMIDRAGGKIVGVSTVCGMLANPNGINVRELLDHRDRFGDKCIKHCAGRFSESSADLYWQKADVLIPGARTMSIGNEDVDQLNVRFIVPIANAVATPETEIALHESGIDYLPGFVSNSGGIFCWYLARLDSDASEDLIRQGIRRKVRHLMAAADREGVALGQKAREQAYAKASRMGAESGDSLGGRIAGVMRKVVPQRLAYVVLRKLLGEKWARKNTRICRWYVNARYFS